MQFRRVPRELICVCAAAVRASARGSGGHRARPHTLCVLDIISLPERKEQRGRRPSHAKREAKMSVEFIESNCKRGHKMVLTPTDALVPRVVSTLPLVAGSKVRPTSLRVSSRRTVGYKNRIQL